MEIVTFNSVTQSTKTYDNELDSLCYRLSNPLLSCSDKKELKEKYNAIQNIRDNLPVKKYEINIPILKNQLLSFPEIRDVVIEYRNDEFNIIVFLNTIVCKSIDHSKSLEIMKKCKIDSTSSDLILRDLILNIQRLQIDPSFYDFDLELTSKVNYPYENIPIHHPHWRLESCFGDYETAINEAQYSHDFVLLVFLLIEFLRSYNPFDSWGCHFGHWIDPSKNNLFLNESGEFCEQNVNLLNYADIYDGEEIL